MVHAAVYHLLSVGFEIMMNDISDDWQQLTSDPYVRKWLNGGPEEVAGVQEDQTVLCLTDLRLKVKKSNIWGVEQLLMASGMLTFSNLSGACGKSHTLPTHPQTLHCSESFPF